MNNTIEFMKDTKDILKTSMIKEMKIYNDMQVPIR